MSTKIFNLIILDESGSMSGITKQTISGCNETINTIKASAEKFAGEQEHTVSIFAFQGGGKKTSRYIVKNVPASTAQPITGDDYEPWGNTPLYDAVGSCIADIKASIGSNRDAVASITIITDGYENSSRHYTHAQVAKMIAAQKELGWNFNFIGANIDVQRVSSSLNIDNCMEFDQDEEGTARMFARERSSKERYLSRISRMRMQMEEKFGSVDAAPLSVLHDNFANAQMNYYEPSDEQTDDNEKDLPF